MPASRDSSARHEDDAPKSKRQRIALACEACRARKTRCDGARPHCGLCIGMGFRCEYPRPAPGPASYGKNDVSSRVEDRLLALEQMLRSIVSKDNQPANPSAQQAATPPASTSTASGGLTSDPRNEMHSSYDMGMQFATSIGTTSIGAVDDTVDGMGVITFADEVTSGYFGPTSNSDFLSYISHALAGERILNLSQTQIAGANATDTSYISRPPSPRSSARIPQHHPEKQESVDLYVLPPESKIVELVDLFFEGTGLLFPYIYRKHVLEGLSHMKNTHFYGVRRSWLCLLNTIMAFGTCVTARPHERNENWAAEGDTFLLRALGLLPNIALKPANIETLQALLLVTQYLQGTQHSAQTWNLQGTTVQAAFQIGVHCMSKGAKFSPLEQEIRNRCWHMCFILDKTCSMTFGRPPSISNDTYKMPLPLEVELEVLDNESYTDNVDQMPRPGSPTAAVYIHSICIYKVIGEIIESVYENNIQTQPQMSSPELFRRIISIDPRLSSCKASLPPHVRIQSKEAVHGHLQDPATFAPLSIVLTLRYHNARLLLHRAMMSRFLIYDRTTGYDTEEWSFLHDFGRSSLEVTVRSAIELIEIIATASEGELPMLTTWWFSIYYIFSSSLAIFAAMVIANMHGVHIQGFVPHNSTETLRRALTTLDALGVDTRIAVRCRKYLERLLQVAPSINITALMPGDNSILHEGVSAQNEFAIPVDNLANLSPLDLDIGPFVAGTDWDMLSQFMDHQEQNRPQHDRNRTTGQYY